DPRAIGGGVAASAIAYSGPLVINTPTLVRARVLSGGTWSAITEFTFYPPQDLSKLVLTELMYHPPDLGLTDGDEFEFLELKNAGTNTLNLDGFKFTAGISFTFTNGTQLGPGQFFVLARNPGALQTRYPGLVVNGTYSGRLDNAGETVQLSSPNGGVVWSVTYNDRAPWPLAADGHGFSVVPRQPLAHPNSDNGVHWRASSVAGGSPGADDPEPTLPPVVVNEVLTRTTPPQVDWIELFNPTDAEADLSGWFLSDDGGAPIKYRLPQGTTLPPRSYRVFTEEQFNAQPLLVTSFSLDSMGDAVYLSSGDAATNLTGYSHGFSFGAAANGVSFGRYVNSVGEEQFPAQLSVTPGAANSAPRVGPVVIQEIHYHPGLGGDEFIELGNVTGNEVPLFDPAFPTNTWRVNGLSFHFPP
ncbi:MAG TPA: lamin tail domain-containing protein, partial [Candidatus Dormibacteraeota bacterium]|nr:lamin tail domain-containing protein [Candidatus Dormibacteraeota bacterium]